MTQYLRAPVVFEDNWVQSPAPTWLFVTTQNSSSRRSGSDTFFWLPWGPRTNVIQRQNTHTHEIIEKNE